MKTRTIKVTEQQLRETQGEAFKYLDPNNQYTSFNGQKEISVSGNITGEEPGVPTIGDDVSDKISPQTYNRFRSYGNLYPHSMREGVDMGSLDKTNPELDILSNGNSNDDITRVPSSVIRKLDILLNSMETLTLKQVGMVMNKLIENFDWEKLPMSWRKELIRKINATTDTLNNNQIR